MPKNAVVGHGFPRSGHKEHLVVCFKIKNHRYEYATD